MIYASAIVLAAGRGKRFASGVSKPLVKIGSQPLIIYCLKALGEHPSIKDIVVVVNTENKEAVVSQIARYRIAKISAVVIGGVLRQDSVRCGLKAIGADTDLVLIHDAARPFIDKGRITSVITQAKSTGAATLGVPVKATIKQARGKFVVRTLDRDSLWEIQTPQVFRKGLILEAYRKFAGLLEVTDDAMLVEKLGVKVSIALGSYYNIKITTPEDLVLAQGIARKWNTG